MVRMIPSQTIDDWHNRGHSSSASLTRSTSRSISRGSLAVENCFPEVPPGRRPVNLSSNPEKTGAGGTGLDVVVGDVVVVLVV